MTSPQPTRYRPNTTHPIRKCGRCHKALTGKFVKALGNMFHLHCFTCLECDDIVVDKFFPVTGPDGASYALCEKDYYKRLDLVCCQCGGALHGSYITALGKKYHSHHFSCSVCPTIFGPDDTYYEHDNQVYCHYHYSILIAIKCTGCQTAILKQYVEINRSGTNENWHPECYMIYKFWNIKLSAGHRRLLNSSQEISLIPYNDHQIITEEKVHQIWTILSSYEESSASCISNMLLQVSNGNYIDGVRMAEKFILHVEVLFSAIDHLEDQLAQFDDSTDLHHNKEPSHLTKKIISFFSLLSHTQEAGVRKLGITQELLSLVTGLAHYLKSLIRVALNGALKMDRDYGSTVSIHTFLATLTETSDRDKIKRFRQTYLNMNITSDLCHCCKSTLDEECILHEASSNRWHLDCLRCVGCCAQLKLTYRDAHYEKSSETVFCGDCAPSISAQGHFKYVTLLEQYTFLLKVALKRLYSLLKIKNSSTSLDLDSLLGNSKRSISPRSKSPDSMTSRKSSLPAALVSSKERDSMDTVDRRQTKSPTKLDRKVSTSSANVIKRRPTYQKTISKNHREPLTLIPDAENSNVQIPVDLNSDSTEPKMNLKLTEIVPNNEITETVVLNHSPTPINHRNSPSLIIERQPSSRYRDAITTKLWLSELSGLEHFMVKHLAIMKLVPLFHNKFTLEDLSELIDDRPKSIWSKFKSTIVQTKKINKPSDETFCVPLETSVDKSGVQSSISVSPGVVIPLFLEKCISAMMQKDMSTEGIFRKNGNIRRLKELSELIDKDIHSVDLTQDNPIQLAALMKKYFRELPEPLLTWKLHKLFVATQELESEEFRKRALHLIMTLLPKPNRDTIEILTIFLCWVSNFCFVDENTGSKMNLENLAKVMAPNLIYSNSKNPINDESFMGAHVVLSILKYYEELWAVPDDIANILKQGDFIGISDDNNSKDILKKFDHQLKLMKKSHSHRDLPDTF